MSNVLAVGYGQFAGEPIGALGGAQIGAGCVAANPDTFAGIRPAPRSLPSYTAFADHGHRQPERSGIGICTQLAVSSPYVSVWCLHTISAVNQKPAPPDAGAVVVGGGAAVVGVGAVVVGVGAAVVGVGAAVVGVGAAVV